uniref:EF-hand domain-containing protein n=1 Tax=Branchiostoma floridae TaxID=7739 RepID=C3XW46_BRAFL|eukprot:XP_002611570.1 hypothetical protein BRAFLDRAFT_63791 [Branchiostoma floridae]
MSLVRSVLRGQAGRLAVCGCRGSVGVAGIAPRAQPSFSHKPLDGRRNYATDFKLTDFQKQKLMNCFEFYDVNKDGIIRFEDDFQAALNRYIDLNGWTEESPAYMGYRVRWTAFWQDLYFGKLSRLDPKLRKDNNEITREEFLAMWERALKDSSELAKTPGWVQQLIPDLYKAIDVDGDGSLKLRDYENLFKAFGRLDNVEHVFDRLDANKDGQISRTEWILHFQDYLFSEDRDRRGNLIWGNLGHGSW